MPIGEPKDLSQIRLFFLEPALPRQRQYEALRAYFLDGRPPKEVARAFGYSLGAFHVLCHHFRRDPAPLFFASPRRGPQSQPKKSAARELIVRLRKQNHSIYEISQALKKRQQPLSPTAVREVLKTEGFAPLPRRADDERPQGPRPTVEPVSNVAEFSLAPRRFTTRCGGLFLFVPDLVRLDTQPLARAAQLPGSKMIPADHALRACLALKLWSIERKSHVMALVADQGLALFAGLNAIPKKSYFSEYPSRIDHRTTTAFLARWHAQVHGTDLFPGTSFNLDFHSVPHYGEDPIIERHYVSARKFRTPRVFEQTVALAGRQFHQLFIQDLGHEEPTILLTNEREATHKTLITRYAQRMLIENALSDAVRFFHIDALSSAVGLKVDFDMALLVLASGLYRLVGQRMRGYGDAQARQIFRDLIDMPADVTVGEKEVTVSFHRRAHLPIVLASGLLDKPVSVPWWDGLPLRLTTYKGPA